MPQGIVVSLSTVFLFSASQLLNCGKAPKGPDAAYQRFVKKVSEGKCATVYNALDRESQARLDTYLETMVGLAFSVQDRAGDQLPALSDYVPGQNLPVEEEEEEEAEERIVFERPEPIDAGVLTQLTPEPAAAKPPEEPQPPAASVAASVVALSAEELETQQRADALAALRDLRGKALFKALCRKNPPPMALLFREAGLAEYQELPVGPPVVRGQEAELPVTFEKKKKKKKTENEDDAETKPEPPEPVRLVQEGTRWRIVLSPMELRWYQAEDGRVVPRFRSPILSLGVEMDAIRTPTHAYERIVHLVEAGECDDFYDSLDAASRARMERVTPLMVGFASALGSTDTTAVNLPTRDPRALVLSICKHASHSDLKNSGVLLGQVVHEEVVGNRATLTVRSRHDKRVTRDVYMIRKRGEWFLSIEAFSDMAFDEEANKLADLEEED